MIHIVANVGSGKGIGRKNLKKIESYLKKNSIDYSVYRTEYKGHAREIVNAISSKGEECTVAVLGGDGTFHEALNGIADFEKTKLGFIPSGRGNDFARAIKAPKNPLDALCDILRGEERKIDFIDVSGVRCLNVAGTGLDVAVLERVDGKSGTITYLKSLVYCLKHFNPYKITTVVNGEKHDFDCIMAGVCNGIAIGGNMKISPLSEVDDGLLDVVVITMPEDGKVLPVLPKFLVGKHMGLDITHHFRCKEVEILAPYPVQLDGEIYRDLPLHCKIEKAKLRTFVSHSK